MNMLKWIGVLGGKAAMQRVVLFIFGFGSLLEGWTSTWASAPTPKQEAAFSLGALFEELNAHVQNCQEAYWQRKNLLLSRAYEAFWQFFVHSVPHLEVSLKQDGGATLWNRLSKVLVALCFYGQELQRSTCSSDKAAQGFDKALEEDPVFQKMLKETPLLGGALQILAHAARARERLVTEKVRDPSHLHVAQAVVQQGSFHTLETIQKILDLCHFTENWKNFVLSTGVLQKSETLSEKWSTSESGAQLQEPDTSLSESFLPVVVGEKELAKESALFASKLEKKQKTQMPQSSAEKLTDFVEKSPLKEDTDLWLRQPSDKDVQPFPLSVKLMALTSLSVLVPSHASSYKNERMKCVQEYLRESQVSKEP